MRIGLPVELSADAVAEPDGAGADGWQRRLDARLARLGQDHVDELVLTIDQHLDGAGHEATTRREVELGPFGLRLARALDGGP